MILTRTWTFTTLAHLAGLAAPAEGSAVYAWDAARRLYRLDRAGKLRAQETLPFQPALGAASADGRTLAFLSQEGSLLLRDADGANERAEQLRIQPTALALDSFGQRFLAADRDRGVRLCGRKMDLIREVRMPRPLAHVAFAHRRRAWFGAAAQGYLAEHREDGSLAWQDTPMFECGGMAVDAEDHLLLACHGGGLRRYPASAPLPSLPELTPCERVAACAGSGRIAVLVTPPGGAVSKLALLEGSGAVSAFLPLPGRASHVALAPRGDLAIVGLADGTLLGFAAS